MQLFSFLETKFQNGTHLKKGLFLTYFSHFFSHQGKDTKKKKKKKKSFSTYSTYIHDTYTYFAHTIDSFAFKNLQKKKKKKRIHRAWFLFGVSPDVDSLSGHFVAINR